MNEHVLKEPNKTKEKQKAYSFKLSEQMGKQKKIRYCWREH